MRARAEKEVMTAGAAVTVAAAASDSSIGPGLAVTCDVVVHQDCERVKGATPHFISQRKLPVSANS